MSYKNTHRWQRGGGSVVRHQDEKKRGWHTMMVPGDTLAGILAPLQYQEIDLIQIDIEGLDEVILRQVDAFLMQTTRPRVVCMETCEEFCLGFLQETWVHHHQSATTGLWGP